MVSDHVYPPWRVLGRYMLLIASTALVAGLITACMVRFSPGFGADERELDPRLSEAGIQAVRQEVGAERNPVRFYLLELGGVLRGKLGYSRSLGRPVAALIGERIPVTARLLTAGLAESWALTLALAAPLTLAKGRRARNIRPAFHVVNMVLLCIPAAVAASFAFIYGGPLQLVFAAVLVPRMFQYVTGILGRAASLPHVAAARARGVPAAGILLRHIAPSAAPKLLALAGVSVSMAFAAAIPVEVLCDLPGIGQLAWTAASSRDLPVLIVLVFLVVLMNQVSNLLSDFAISLAAGRAA